MGWAAHTSEPVAVETVPGTHITLLAEPQVQTFARRLATWLDRADRDHGGGNGSHGPHGPDGDGTAPAAPRSER